MITIEQLLAWGKSQLAEQDSALLEAQVLLAHALKVERTYLYTWPQKEVNEVQQQDFEALIAQRVAGEPLAYILGQKEFWSLPMKVSRDTLIPRWDTEFIVETALKLLPEEGSLSILDLGTGSGPIACALAHERPAWHFTASDVSPAAIGIAQENAQRLNLNNIDFVVSDWFSNLAGKRFDAILSNPPYIRSNDLHLMQGDLPKEPRIALTAGPSGLESFQKILSVIHQHLNPHGLLAFEHGYDQGESVRRLLIHFGFHDVDTFTDHAGNERVTVGWS